MGRSRSCAASTAASTIEPVPRSCSANSTMRIAFFAGEADQHDQADLAVHVVGEAARRASSAPSSASGTARMTMSGRATLVLRREHEEHEREAGARTCRIDWRAAPHLLQGEALHHSSTYPAAGREGRLVMAGRASPELARRSSGCR